MNTTVKNLDHPFLPLPLEYHLLERVQNGDVTALSVLVQLNLPFIKRLTYFLSKGKGEEFRMKKWNDLLYIFETVARIILESKVPCCFQEAVIDTALYWHENPPELRLEPHTIRRYLKLLKDLDPLSFDTPVGQSNGGDTATLGDFYQDLGHRPEYGAWLDQARNGIWEALKAKKFNNDDRRLIRMLYFEDFNEQEAAFELKLPLARIKGQRSKIMRSLKHDMHQDFDQ